MARYVALLRGVNVGGVRLAMADLRAVATRLGLADVSTYVQSGNLTFSGSGDPASLAADLEAAIARDCGIAPRVIVLTADEWAQLVRQNPYPDEQAGTRLHAVVAAQDYTAEQVAATHALRDTAREAGSADDVTVLGRVAYLHLPDGMGRSLLAEKLGRSRATGHREATARNWRTVLALQERLAG